MDSFSGLPLTRASVQEAHKLIAPHVHQTPVLRCRTLDELASTPRGEGGAKPVVRLWFKCENLQRVGAFKARGAFHAVGRLVEGGWKGGVVTHSSGVSPPSHSGFSCDVGLFLGDGVEPEPESDEGVQKRVTRLTTSQETTRRPSRSRPESTGSRPTSSCPPSRSPTRWPPRAGTAPRCITAGARRRSGRRSRRRSWRRRGRGWCRLMTTGISFWGRVCCPLSPVLLGFRAVGDHGWT